MTNKNRDKAIIIVSAIIQDLNENDGFRNDWHYMNAEEKQKVRKDWIKIAEEILNDDPA